MPSSSLRSERTAVTPMPITQHSTAQQFNIQISSQKTNSSVVFTEISPVHFTHRNNTTHLVFQLFSCSHSYLNNVFSVKCAVSELAVWLPILKWCAQITWYWNWGPSQAVFCLPTRQGLSLCCPLYVSLLFINNQRLTLSQLKYRLYFWYFPACACHSWVV